MENKNIQEVAKLIRENRNLELRLTYRRGSRGGGSSGWRWHALAYNDEIPLTVCGRGGTPDKAINKLLEKLNNDTVTEH